jgi:hypothetical protein
LVIPVVVVVAETHLRPFRQRVARAEFPAAEVAAAVQR